MNKYHRGSDVESIVVVNGGALSLYHNIYVMVLNQVGDVVKYMSLKAEVGFEDGDLTINDDVGGELRAVVRRDETSVMTLGKYYYQVRVAVDDSGFTNSVRMDSDTAVGFSLVSSVEETSTDVVLRVGAKEYQSRIENEGLTLTPNTPFTISYSSLGVTVPMVIVYDSGVNITDLIDVGYDKSNKEVSLLSSTVEFSDLSYVVM